MVAAKQAADAYLSAVPADVAVGLLSFATTPTLRVTPTTDRTAVRAAVAALTPAGDTALYDAVLRAGAALGTTGVRNELVISDGADTSSTASPAGTTAAVARSGIGLDAVSLGTTPAETAGLTALARAGGGQVITTDQADELAAAFRSAAQTQATQLLVAVTVPPDRAGTSAQVAVTARAGAQSVGDTSVVVLPSAGGSTLPSAASSYGPQPVAESGPGLASRPWVLPLAIVLVLAGLFGILAIAFTSTDPDSQTSGRVRRRLSRYSLTARAPAPSTVATSGNLGQGVVARSAVELAGRVVQSRDLDTGLGAKLEAAGVPLRPAEWMLVHTGIAILASLVFMLLSGFSVLATLLGLALGVLLPYGYLAVKESRRKAAFAAQLPDTLQLLSGSLAAGYSLPQAVDTVARESGGPMAVELNRALVENRLGVPLEDALDTVARRMDSIDFSWVVMAIRIQRDVGGNLAEVLSNVAATMRERERLRRQVDVLSAEGRLSAFILGGLPLVFTIYLVLVRPEYVSLLITTPLGVLMVVVGLMLFVGGVFWLRKVIRVEV
jgi:tight adherence protein B